MKTTTIINCFINGASHEYVEQYGRSMLDEDLSMAFDEAELFALALPDCSVAQAHEAGKNYIIHGGRSYAPLAEAKVMGTAYALILETLSKAGIEVINDTPAQVSFDMRDDYMYIDIAGVRICVDAEGQAEIIYTYPE